MAKRIRDIGLPGWWTALAILIFTGIVATVVSDNASNGLQTLIWIVLLLLVPGNMLAKGAGTTDSG